MNNPADDHSKPSPNHGDGDADSVSASENDSDSDSESEVDLTLIANTKLNTKRKYSLKDSLRTATDEFSAAEEERVRAVRFAESELEAERDDGSTPPDDDASAATTKTGWQPVKTSKSPKQSTTKLYNFGVHVSKMVQHDETGFHPDDIKMLLDLVQQIDNDVTFLPHNNDPKLARHWKQVANNYNYSSMMNIKTKTWGKPAENKHKSELSFFISSDSISSAKDISSNLMIQDFLHGAKFRMGYHSLHESQSCSVGFLLGKSVKHAYWNDLTSRLTTHINFELDRLRDAAKCKVNLKTSPKPTPIPATIPIQLTPTTLSMGQVTTKALSLFVGEKDRSYLERLLQTNPFPDVEIVATAWKRSDPDAYANRLALHNALEDKSTAIKIIDTTDEVRSYLREIRHIAFCSTLIIDIAEARNTPERGTLYIQCLKTDRCTVLQWAQDSLDAFNTDNTDSPHEAIITDPSPQAESPTNSVRTFNTTGSRRTYKSIITVTQSKYADILQDYTPVTDTSNKTFQPSTKRVIPLAINVKVKSYAQILASSNNSNGSASTNGSKSDNSTIDTTSTAKTQREIELEDMNEKLTTKNTWLEKENNKLQSRLTQIETESKEAAHQRTTQQQQMDAMEQQRIEQQQRLDSMELQMKNMMALMYPMPPPPPSNYTRPMLPNLPSPQQAVPESAAAIETPPPSNNPTHLPDVPAAPDPTHTLDASTEDSMSESKRKRDSPHKQSKKTNPSYPEFSDAKYLTYASPTSSPTRTPAASPTPLDTARSKGSDNEPC